MENLIKLFLWVEGTLDERIEELIKIVEDENFKPSPTKEKEIWDNSAVKYRTINEPPLYPD